MAGADANLSLWIGDFRPRFHVRDCKVKAEFLEKKGTSAKMFRTGIQMPVNDWRRQEQNSPIRGDRASDSDVKLL